MDGGQWVEVATLAELRPGEVQRREVGGRVLALVNSEGLVHAVDAACPHQGGPLDRGKIWEGKLECPWHHFLFDLATGANIYPANVFPPDMPELRAHLLPLKVFPVRVEAGRVFVRIADSVSG